MMDIRVPMRPKADIVVSKIPSVQKEKVEMISAMVCSLLNSLAKSWYTPLKVFGEKFGKKFGGFFGELFGKLFVELFVKGLW